MALVAHREGLLNDSRWPAVSQFIDLLLSVQIPLSGLSSLAFENEVFMVSIYQTCSVGRSIGPYAGNCIIIGHPAEDKRRNWLDQVFQILQSAPLNSLIIGWVRSPSAAADADCPRWPIRQIWAGRPRPQLSRSHPTRSAFITYHHALLLLLLCQEILDKQT